MQRNTTMTGQRSTAHQGPVWHANQPRENMERGTGDTRPAFGKWRKPEPEHKPAGITGA